MRGIKMSKKSLNTIIIVLGGIPLLLYPFVIIADLMTIAGVWSGDESIFLIIIVYLFLFLTSSYLITYIICLLYYLRRKNGKLVITSLPLIQIMFVILVGFIWSALNK